MARFVVTVKERTEGQPCFLEFELYDETDMDMQVDNKSICLGLIDGSNLEDALAIAKTINHKIDSIFLL